MRICFYLILLFQFSNTLAASKIFKGTDYNRSMNIIDNQQALKLQQEYGKTSCITKTGLQVSCGYRSEWANGDDTYNWDPFMNQIPRGSKVIVDMQCDPKTTQFRMNVKIQMKECPKGKTNTSQCPTVMKNFKSPYVQGYTGLPFSNEPTSWPMSPGLYPDNITNLPYANASNAALTNHPRSMTEYHLTSANTDYPNAQMPYALWLKDGIAIHGSDCNNLGLPRSHGCINLCHENAFALYNLARRVGTNNVIYNWNGYGPNDPKTGRPACAGSEERRRQILIARKQITDADRVQALQELSAGTESIMNQEGRTRVATDTETEKATRSVNSVPSKKE